MNAIRFPVGSTAAGLAVAIVTVVLGSVAEGQRILLPDQVPADRRRSPDPRSAYPTAGVGIIYWTAAAPLNLLGAIIFEDWVFATAFTALMLTWAWSDRDWRVLRVADDDDECRVLVWPGSGGRTRITLAQLAMIIGLLNTVR